MWLFIELHEFGFASASICYDSTINYILAITYLVIKCVAVSMISIRTVSC